MGVFPAALAEDLHHRSVDVGTGALYLLDANGERLGAFLAGSVVVAGHTWDQRILRLMPEAQVRIMDDPHTRRVGWGASVRCTVEYATFLPTDKMQYQGGVGSAEGEAAIGAYVEALTTQILQEQTYAVVLGLTFRIPLAAGIVVVPIR